MTFYTRRVSAWPATDPLVTAVGGTQLEQNDAGYESVAWNDTYNQTFTKVWTGSTHPSPFSTGGGTSEFFARPSYQSGVKAVTGADRGVPDISMSAACNGAVDVYSSYATKGWSLACGTSEATPEFAAIVAIADQIAGRSLGVINATLYKLYAQHAAGIVDVTSGNNTVAFYPKGSKSAVTVKGYSAKQGLRPGHRRRHAQRPAVRLRARGQGVTPLRSAPGPRRQAPRVLRDLRSHVNSRTSGMTSPPMP